MKPSTPPSRIAPGARSLLIPLGLVLLVIVFGPCQAHAAADLEPLQLKVTWDDKAPPEAKVEAPPRPPRRRHQGIEFRYRDDDYRTVSLAGDFTDWAPVPMEHEADGWSVVLEPEPGRHYYRFEVQDRDGSWEAIDPGNPDARKLVDRGWVSVLDVEPYEDRPFWEEEEQDWEDEEEERYDGASRERVRRELDPWREREDGWIQYQRVDGLALGWAPSYFASEGVEPSAKGFVGYGFKSKRWSFGVTVLQPLLPHNWLWLKLEGRIGTDFTDRTSVSDDENNIATVFFREDFRDYYRREGGHASFVFGGLSWLRLEVGLSANEFESLENTSTWSFRKGEFQPNPAIDEGLMRSAFGRVRLGGPFTHIAGTYERSDTTRWGGDFDFELVTAELRGRLSMGPRQHLDLRLAGGGNLKGELPRQRHFVLGGLGTVRGYDYQSLVIPADERDTDAYPPYGGELMVLANAAYTFTIAQDFLDLSLLYDVGMAWEDRHAEIEIDQLKDSAGLGLIIGDDLYVNIMKPLDGHRQDPVVELRLRRTF